MQVTIDFTWIKSDFYRATRRSARLTRTTAIAAVLVLAITYAGHILLFGICVFIASLLIEMYVVLPMVAWHRTIARIHPRHVVIDELGIETTVAGKSTMIEWTRIDRIRENSISYLCYQRDSPNGVPLLKTFFTCPHDEAVFRNILRRHARATLRPNLELDNLPLITGSE